MVARLFAYYFSHGFSNTYQNLCAVDALILATEDNPDPKAYLLANPDVAARGVDPLLHLRNHGLRERRYQINLNYLTETAEFRREKFKLFAPHLDLPLPRNVDTFPTAASGETLQLSDYQSESACGTLAVVVDEMMAHPDRLYMDLGCGLRHRVYRNCLCVEVYRSRTADLIVAPTCRYPIKNNTFDGISCFAVPEHTRQPWVVVEEMHRMLKPGGKVWIDWPFLQPVHGYPSHYYNATREGLRALFEDNGFHTDEIGTLEWQGPDATMMRIMNVLMRSLPPAAQKKIGKMRVSDLLSHPANDPFWKDLMNQIDDTTRSTLARGNNLVATKLP